MPQGGQSCATDPIDHVKGTEEQRIQELAEQLTELLAHNDPSVVFYALSEARGDFRSSPQTLKALEGLMASPIEALSEAAAKTRFTLRGASEAQTLKLALARFAKDPLRRVRHAACQHLGSRQYKGKRDVFNVLLEAAKREDEEALIRGCAARELGNIATDRDIKALIALLHYPEIQQATVTALQRGLATPKPSTPTSVGSSASRRKRARSIGPLACLLTLGHRTSPHAP